MSEACPVCGGDSSIEAFSAARQPAMLNRLLTTRAQALQAAAVDLRFRDCCACGFVWNAAFDPSTAMYAPGYDNDQSASPTFRTHTDRVIETLSAVIRDVPGRILEIGCGQGDFLRRLAAAIGRRAVGFDPALASSIVEDDVELHAACFTHQAFDPGDDAVAMIVCRHVLEHIADPVPLLRTMRETLRDRGGLVCIEVPCVDWIATNLAFHDFFNEHCSLFSPASLRRALTKAGFGNIRLAHVFGGQYLSAIATAAHREKAEVVAPPRRQWSDVTNARDEVQREIGEALAARPCCIWGAGAKGVSVVNHLGIGCDEMPHLIDVHPRKQRRFVPLTGQQVIAPQEFAARGCADTPPLVLAMNPNYVPEIGQQLRELGSHAEVLGIGGRLRVALHR